MKQSTLDVWEIRGLDAMTRILGARTGEPVSYTQHTVQNMRVHVANLQKILAHMEQNQGADSDPASDMYRMDRWFCTGFNNLLQYLNDRLKEGPPMSEQFRSELFFMMQRYHVTINTPGDPSTQETNDESGTARLS